MSNFNATPWGTPGQPSGVTSAVKPELPTEFIPESKVSPDPPFAPSVWLNPEQARANADHAKLLRADFIYRSAIGHFVHALYNWRVTEFYTGRPSPKPIFAVSFAVQTMPYTQAELAELPFGTVAELYELPK